MTDGIDVTREGAVMTARLDRKSTRLNSSHSSTSYAVFCLKKKKSSQCVCFLVRKSRQPRGLVPSSGFNTIPRGHQSTTVSAQFCEPAFPFFFQLAAPPAFYTLSLHDALPI